MKAIVYTEYGPPDVLKMQDVPKPTPQDHEVIIKVHAAAVNPADWRMMRATPFLARLDGGLTKPRNTILGQDVAGVVESVGAAVTRFKVGDAVFGELFVSRAGGFAEYTRVDEKALALKPENISFEMAASVPLAGMTAFQGLRDYAALKPGETVLINGASGGVGTFAVQLAKHLGAAEVTAVCSGRNAELVRSIGADHVIDYTQQDFTQLESDYDVVLDMVGNYTSTELKSVLRENGRAVVGGFTELGNLFNVLVLGSMMSIFDSRKIRQLTEVKPNPEDLAYLGQLLAAGTLVPVIDRTYPFSETAEAIRYIETGRARGKVVVVMD